MSVERIVDTYEITIKDRYPYLDYILKNQSTFSKIEDFYNVVEMINHLMKITDHKYTRKQCESMAIKDIDDDYVKENAEKFIISWKKIDNFLGMIQVDCKPYGKMNN